MMGSPTPSAKKKMQGISQYSSGCEKRNNFFLFLFKKIDPKKESTEVFK